MNIVKRFEKTCGARLVNCSDEEIDTRRIQLIRDGYFEQSFRRKCQRNRSRTLVERAPRLRLGSPRDWSHFVPVASARQCSGKARDLHFIFVVKYGDNLIPRQGKLSPRQDGASIATLAE